MKMYFRMQLDFLHVDLYLCVSDIDILHIIYMHAIKINIILLIIYLNETWALALDTYKVQILTYSCQLPNQRHASALLRPCFSRGIMFFIQLLVHTKSSTQFVWTSFFILVRFLHTHCLLHDQDYKRWPAIQKCFTDARSRKCCGLPSSSLLFSLGLDL